MPREGTPGGAGREETAPPEAPYEELRPLMFSIAYRMTGSVGDAEDIVQEAFLGLTRALSEGTVVESPKAYLAAATTRHAINYLRSARVRREAYVGTWLPEPLVTDSPGASGGASGGVRGGVPGGAPRGEPDPAERAEMSDSLSMAFLVLLESLSPVERAVFLLREVFGYEYEEVARIVGKSEQNCRQIFARARRRIGDRQPRFESSRAQGEELARRFFAAAAGGEMSPLLELLAPDVAFYGDGGGKALALREPIHGRLRIARFILGLARRAQLEDVHFRMAWVNGQPGAVSFDGSGQVINVFVLEAADGVVHTIRSVVNPEKLGHLGPVSEMARRGPEDLACRPWPPISPRRPRRPRSWRASPLRRTRG
jgi:RNA polymerase sigma factor (sigma-70 family)